MFNSILLPLPRQRGGAADGDPNFITISKLKFEMEWIKMHRGRKMYGFVIQANPGQIHNVVPKAQGYHTKFFQVGWRAFGSP